MEDRNQWAEPQPGRNGSKGRRAPTRALKENCNDWGGEYGIIYNRVGLKDNLLIPYILVILNPV